MTSEKQIAANRENAQLSTGPVTPEGKEKIKLNALKHGACSKAILLPHEDKGASTALGDILVRTYSPESELEYKHLAELQECEWRMDRIRKAQSNMLALGIRENMSQFADEEDIEVRRGLAEAAAWRANTRQFNLFRREENALREEKRILHDILGRLLELRIQKQRKQMALPIGQRANPRNGFVSHTAPKTAAESASGHEVNGKPPVDRS